MSNGVEVTLAVDVSGLNAAIPKIVAFGHRTVQQVCVTSAYWICNNAKQETHKMFPTYVENRLGVFVTPFTKKGNVSKAKKRTTDRNVYAVGKAVPLGVLVIMARMKPNSNFNAQTGGYWKISPNYLPTGPGTAKSRQAIIGALLDRMIASRRSTSAYLKSGWVQPMRTLYASPFMVRSGAGFLNAVKTEGATDVGAEKLHTESLGVATITESSDAMTVTCENLTPKGPNEKLDERHRYYAQFVLLPPLQAAIAREERQIYETIEQFLSKGEIPGVVDI